MDWICVLDWGGVRLAKVLILIGFYDIGCDIGIFRVDGGKVGILLGFVGFLTVVFIF